MTKKSTNLLEQQCFDVCRTLLALLSLLMTDDRGKASSALLQQTTCLLRKTTDGSQNQRTSPDRHTEAENGSIQETSEHQKGTDIVPRAC